MKNTPPEAVVLSMGTAELDRYLTAQDRLNQTTTSDYVEQGAALVNLAAVEQLRGLLLFLHEKRQTIKDSKRLALRVALLAAFFEESALTARPRLTPALKEATFGLLYFLKGYDQIPDTLPEIGLLDDAMVVEVVIRRNEAELRDHWAARGRSWPQAV